MGSVAQPPKRLDEWLGTQAPTSFPGAANYAHRFTTIADEFEKIARETDRAALLAELRKETKPIEDVVYLTHHDPGHVDTVIQRASDLVMLSEAAVTPYEAYLLLVSIHVHDAGLVYGRAGHAEACRKILWALGGKAGDDTPEKQVIADIASAHSTGVSGDRDTIGKLQPACHTLGQRVRPQFLAAVLRFADELADDKSRASRFLLDQHLITKSSEVFHAYSSSLHSVVVADRGVSLVFYLTDKEALARYTKGNGETYLLEEILARSLKMHLERVYCMRFFPPERRVDSIDVKIEVAGSRQNSFLRVLDAIAYQLTDGGYPEPPPGGIYALCPALEGRADECRRKLAEARGERQNGQV